MGLRSSLPIQKFERNNNEPGCMMRAFQVMLLVGLAVVGGFLLLQRQARSSQRQLSELLPKTTAITLYDVNDVTANSNTLASAASTPFPVDAFRRACASATSEGGIGVTVWKGSSRAVLTLSDGTRRQARFSYHGAFFTVEGISGRFVVHGGAASEFQRLHEKLIQEQFVPRRLNKPNDAMTNHAL